jgi:glutathione synthase/RimK-type ligase-like ATP-grasp enzyme
LGLRFGAIDFILTPEGRYIFLEINPNGEWSWIDAAADLPITETICNLLTELAATAPKLPPEVDLT